MTWPKQYGGGERTALERYVVLEEMLAAGAPVAAHWIGDRQAGPLILRLGTEEQRREFLPRIVSGELAFAIGLSEPDSGSDLASLRTRAERVPGGWRINGRKVWTTNAHHCDFMIALLRTSPSPDQGRGTRVSGSSWWTALLGHLDPPHPRPRRRGGLQRDHLRRRVRARLPAGGPGRQWLGAGDRRTGLRTRRAGALPVLAPAARRGARRPARRARRARDGRPSARPRRHASADVARRRPACSRTAARRSARRRW